MLSDPDGAAYYYHTEPNTTIGQTLKDVHAAAQNSTPPVPFQYVLLDSWYTIRALMQIRALPHFLTCIFLMCFAYRLKVVLQGEDGNDSMGAAGRGRHSHV